MYVQRCSSKRIMTPSGLRDVIKKTVDINLTVTASIGDTKQSLTGAAREEDSWYPSCIATHQIHIYIAKKIWHYSDDFVSPDSENKCIPGILFRLHKFSLLSPLRSTVKYIVNLKIENENIFRVKTCANGNAKSKSFFQKVLLSEQPSISRAFRGSHGVQNVTGRVGSGRVGSGQEVFKLSLEGSGQEVFKSHEKKLTGWVRS